ncbi:MAG: PBECR2 nuclease fold domain-containing protein [Cellulosilyticaceae bacterium]
MKRQAVLEESKYKTQIAGVLEEAIATLLQVEVNQNEILIYPGAIKHMKKRHPHAFREYFKKVPEILANPDYVGMSGQNPTRIEFVKQYKESILVALKYNEDNQLFVSSMYIIEDNRIEKRMHYGRLMPSPIGKTTQKEQKQKYRNTHKGTRR